MPLRFYCDFTPRFLSVENGNYILFGICLSFHATVFFSVQNHIYFIGFLSFHCTIFCIFSKLQLCSVGFLSFHGTVFFFCSKPHLFHWLFVLSLHDFLYLFKTAIMFRWLFVVSRHGVFVCSKICAVQNNVKYNKYSLMMNCPTKCNTQKKVVE